MSQSSEPWFLYLLRCSDNSFYTGISNNVAERVKEHNDGKGALYTKERRPVFLEYQEEYPDKFSARRREEQIKNWGRKKKEMLIKGFPRQGSG